MADSLTATKEAKQSDGLLSVTELVAMFEESEDASYTARGLSERDRDYVDNKQLDDTTLAALKKRRQPPVIDNRIKTKVDYLVGLEKQQRIAPKALPRTPQHENDADGATQGIRYVSDSQDYDGKRSGVWRNMLVEGAGGISVSVVPSRYSPQQAMGTTAMSGPQFDIQLRRMSWDRLFYDPHSSELDFADAGYLGEVLWRDYDDALATYKDNPEAKDILETTLNTAASNTYDDKPKFRVWADKARKRVRIVHIWVKRDDEWYFAEFTKGGILKAGPSPYKNDKGQSDCELFFQSAYVDRDNNRYGLVREMISLQDEINKRRSKSLHLLNTTQIITEQGAFNDPEKARREAARPDGMIVVNPGFFDKTKIETRADLATAHFQLLQEAKNAIDLKGPNATEMGDKAGAGGSNAASGRAIIASQQGGMIQIGDLMDNLRHLDKRVFAAIFNRMRQFWTGEKWVRVTDDERNVKWVGINVDPQQLQNTSPETQQKIGSIVGNIAELDCDIIIDEAPDNVTPQLEQWQALVELAKSGVQIPPDLLIESAPNLKNKDKIIEKMQQPNPQAVEAQKIQTAGMVAEVEKTQSETALNQAKAVQAVQPQSGPAPKPEKFELPPELQAAQAMADVRETYASADHKDAQAYHITQQANLEPFKLAQAAHDKARDRDAKSKAPAA